MGDIFKFVINSKSLQESSRIKIGQYILKVHGDLMKRNLLLARKRTIKKWKCKNKKAIIKKRSLSGKWKKKQTRRRVLVPSFCVIKRFLHQNIGSDAKKCIQNMEAKRIKSFIQLAAMNKEQLRQYFPKMAHRLTIHQYLQKNLKKMLINNL